MSKWQLKRTAQCAKCPWIVGVDPHSIPNGYCSTKHERLRDTIAIPGDTSRLNEPLRSMACHELDDAHCIGWVNHQMNEGNNLPLRLRMIDCENADKIRLRGEQHASFDDTLPKQAQPE